MSKKWVVFIIGGSLAIAIIIATLITGHTFRTVSVSEQMAQMVVEQELPNMHAKGAQVRHLELKFHDTADVLIEVQGTKLGKQYTMVVWALGQPDLARSKKNGEGQLFFKATKVEIRDFQFGSGPKPGETVRRMSDRYLINHPGLQNLAADIAPHVEDWMKVAAEHAAMTVLNNVPVYRFKTDTSQCDDFNCHWKAFLNWFVTASVSDAKIAGNNLEITYSVWALAAAVLLVCGIVGGCVILGIILIVAGLA